jgi:hypothetical protein
MGLYGFKPQFVPAILAGTKRQTIRADRANADRPGDRMFLYQGLRTKNTKRIAQVECIAVQIVAIDEPTFPLSIAWPNVRIDGIALNDSQKKRLAIADGFPSFPAMIAFWEGRLPFVGTLYRWKPIPQFENDAWRQAKRKDAK